MADPWGGDKPRQLFTCRECGTYNDGTVEGEYVIVWEEDPKVRRRFRLVRCLECEWPSLFVADPLMFVSGELLEWDEMESKLLYPTPSKFLSPAIPESLRHNMEEAQRCLDAFAYTAAAIMARRALEVLASEFQIKERSLAKAITKLRDGKHIDERLFLWADELRLAGNDAAHEVTQGTDEQTARDMFQLVEAILDYVYVIQARYEKFKSRRTPPEPPAAEEAPF